MRRCSYQGPAVGICGVPAKHETADGPRCGTHEPGLLARQRAIAKRLAVEGGGVPVDVNCTVTVASGLLAFATPGTAEHDGVLTAVGSDVRSWIGHREDALLVCGWFGDGKRSEIRIGAAVLRKRGRDGVLRLIDRWSECRRSRVAHDRLGEEADRVDTRDKKAIADVCERLERTKHACWAADREFERAGGDEVACRCE